jgi:hypothetical protein
MPKRVDIFFFIAVGASICAGPCQSRPVRWDALSRHDQTAILHSIADRCHLPRSSLTLNDDGLHFKPDPSTKYDRIDCALKRLKKVDGLPMKVGFVSSESYVDQ